MMARLYCAPSGRAFFYHPESFVNLQVLLYSPDGIDFYATKTRAYKGVLEGDFNRKIWLLFQEYMSGQSGVFDFRNDVITFDGETYKFSDVVSPDQYWPIPEVRVPEFLGRITGTQLMLYVSASRFDPSPERVKALFGNAEYGFELVATRSVRRHRGDITSIETDQGWMRLSPIDATGTDWKPRWASNDLEPLNVSDFDIMEVHGGSVVITPRT